MGEAGIEPAALFSNYLTGSPSDQLLISPILQLGPASYCWNSTGTLDAADFRLARQSGTLPAQQLAM